MEASTIVIGEVKTESMPLANRILLYVYLNPSAKDTLEGVAQWWVNEPVARVKRVMDILVDLNLVKEVNSGRSTLYMLGDRPVAPLLKKILVSESK